ncbi:vacuolar protein sorting-associated protein 37B [Sitodiplosis mosellana]|uniref:vacuolar protein sorting-associated protein 37B n=1 Tax=Sitodiplosis mosellana TaxID=263140 RepID=UPI00244496C1|nr:vacuolar protein sorting-associated protein 37B [Sitodiplosis mosellana]
MLKVLQILLIVFHEIIIINILVVKCYIKMYQQFFGQAKSDVAYLTSEELKELLNDDDKLESRINNVVNILDQEKQVIITQNRTIAEENVNKEPEIVERKSRLSELSDQGKSICASIQEKLETLKSKKCDKSPETALALLQAAAAESEEKSDDIAAKFQSKEITIDEYLEQFMAARKLMHARKLKIEKMQEILRRSSIPDTTFRPTGPTNFYNIPPIQPFRHF